MYRKVLITGVTAAALVGASGTALALTGDNSSAAPAASPSGSSASTTAKAAGKHAGHKGHKGKLLKRVSHGSFVVKGKGGTFETHDLIRGTVTAVSATSISVQAADKTTETYAVTKDTKVRLRDAGKGSASTIGKVAKGDTVFVGGTGTSSFTAKHVIDVKNPKVKATK